MFDPQRIRSNYRKRYYYTRKGQVVQAKATEQPFTIDSRQINAYKEFLIKNGLARPMRVSHRKDITSTWNPALSIETNVNNSFAQHIPSGMSLKDIRFEFEKTYEPRDGNYCYGQTLFIGNLSPSEVSSNWATIFPNQDHIYNSNGGTRNTIFHAIDCLFVGTDVNVNWYVGENFNNELYGNIELIDTEYSTYGYTNEKPAMVAPNEKLINTSVFDNPDNFISTTYCFGIITKDPTDDVPSNPSYNLTYESTPTFNTSARPTKVVLDYEADV